VIRRLEKPVIWFCWICGLTLLALISCVVGYLAYKGYRTLGLELIFANVPPIKAILLQERVFDGLFPAIAGSLLLILLSIVWAVPLGVATGIYLAEYASRRWKAVLDILFDILAGIPSIVVGLFGFAIAIFLHRHFSGRIQPCLLVSSLALAFLVLPYIIRTTQVALEGLSPSVRLTAPALGATRLQNILHVLVPKSLSGIVSGIILAIGRCAEDTAVIMLTGVVATAGVPTSILSRYEALPFYIYYISSQYTSPDELSRGYGASLILLALCVLLFAAALLIRRRLTYFTLYRT
jgi:phosphate transport system permease protein